jgi:hypothetical protein
MRKQSHESSKSRKSGGSIGGRAGLEHIGSSQRSLSYYEDVELQHIKQSIAKIAQKQPRANKPDPKRRTGPTTGAKPRWQLLHEAHA